MPTLGQKGSQFLPRKGVGRLDFQRLAERFKRFIRLPSAIQSTTEVAVRRGKIGIDLKRFPTLVNGFAKLPTGH